MKDNKQLAEEVERLTNGKADDDLVTVDDENILFEHLNLLYGNVARITVKDLKRRFWYDIPIGEYVQARTSGYDPRSYVVESCGNHYCKLAGHKTGQATNGRCGCLDGLELKARVRVEKTLLYLRDKVERLVLEIADQVELGKSLIHAGHKVEQLQKQSYGFLDDDKRMAEHFKLKIPMTQGLLNSLLNKKIHDYVEDNKPDPKAAGRALNKISEDIKND